MTTPDKGGAGLPLLAPGSTELPRPGETPSLPSATSSTPGMALAGARVPGGPTLPELDPMSMSRVIAQMANELFAAPIPPSPAPTHADTGALSSPPPLPSAPSAAQAATPAPFAEPSAPFSAPLDFSAIGGPVDPFFGTDAARGLSFPLLDARTATPDMRAPDAGLAAAPPNAAPAPTAFTFDQFEIAPTSDASLRPLNAEPFDANLLKREFPILSEPIRGKRLVWLDNAATSQKPKSVIDRVSFFYEHENSNIHRAAHTLAARATDAYESARETVRRFLKAPSNREIVFVRGATEGINLIAQSWGRRNVAAGDEIVITWLEHHANIVPWQQLCSEKGARLRVAPVDDSGQVILEEYEKLLNEKTKLVSFTQVSNALGTITPAKEMIEMAHRHGAVVVLDGAQAVSHIPVDVQALGCDFFVFSGHKVFAPTGIGVVFGRSELLDAMPPWQGGGNMIQDVTFERTTYQPAPARFEAGTGNIADAVGLGEALDWLSRVGVERVERYEHGLLEYATERLLTVPGLTMIGTAPAKAGVLSFVLRGQKTEEIGGMLDQEGIAVRSGHHCAQPILRRFGLEATVRASLAPYNTPEDIDALVAALHRLQAGQPQ
ncbi:MAG: family 2A encapsulin nanocompartment cargo protein cysteine desulfurase [Polyangiaceae bacterium]